MYYQLILRCCNKLSMSRQLWSDHLFLSIQFHCQHASQVLNSMRHMLLDFNCRMDIKCLINLFFRTTEISISLQSSLNIPLILGWNHWWSPIDYIIAVILQIPSFSSFLYDCVWYALQLPTFSLCIYSQLWSSPLTSLLVRVASNQQC